MELKQMTAIFGILAFLGTFAAVALSLVAIAVLRISGEERVSRWMGNASSWLFGGRGLAPKMGFVSVILLAGYATVLLGASAASREEALGADQEKYFCEIDCHLAYSVTGVETAKTLPWGRDRKAASGIFYMVSVRTRFDEHTISPHRGDGPLTPPPREVAIVDERGRIYFISEDAQKALDQSLGARQILLTQPLRPGESYITKLAFDLPADARGLKLWISSPTEPGWLGRIIIGDEDSIFHKKIYLRLSS
jgi:hypothetical protein